MTAVVEKWTRENGEELWVFWCPGCNSRHSYTTKRPADGSGPLWTMTGTTEKPTFRNSLFYPNANPKCHLYVTNGVIEYLTDCTHALAGKHVPMKPIAE